MILYSNNIAGDDLQTSSIQPNNHWLEFSVFMGHASFHQIECGMSLLEKVSTNLYNHDVLNIEIFLFGTLSITFKQPNWKWMDLF